MTAIFLSHSSQDNDAAAAMKAWLEEQNHTSLFLDFDPEAGIPAGSTWEQVLYRNLRQCQAVIALLSPHWLASKWCFAEIVQTRAQGKPIFPVRIAACDATSILPDLQHIDLTANPQEGYRRLAIGLKERGLNPAEIFDLDPKRPPYPGLHAFDEADAAVFFGRTDEVARAREMLDRLRLLGREAPRFILVLGASGSGKSSLIRAGLIPRLRKDADRWLPVRTFRPQDVPLQELAQALAETFRTLRRPRDWREILSVLAEAADQTPPDGQALIGLARDVQIAAGHRETILLLCLDQAEELFAQSSGREATRFLGLLRAGLESANGQLMALATIRSDFLGRFQTHPILNDEAYDHDFAYETLTVGPMPARNVPQVIVGPAQHHGLELEPGLAEMMVKDMETEDALPLLAYTLRSLWEKYGTDGRLEIREYETLGRLEGSVRTAADQVLKDIRPTVDELAALRSAFVPAMVCLGEMGEYIRRRAIRTELPRGADPLLNRLVNARLLITDRDQTGRETIEVAHEALLRTWPQLAGWLEEDRDKLRLAETVRHAAREWRDSGRPADLLVHRDGRLQEIQVLTQEQRFALAGDSVEKAYLDACLQAQRSREQAQWRRMVQTIAVLIVGMIIISGAAGWALLQRQAARAQRNEALRNQSQFLAGLSRQQTEAGNATNGILLALEALPKDMATPDRPYVPEAEGALYAAVAAQREKAVLRGHEGAVSSAAFSPDGQRLVTASEDTTARLWDTTNGQELAVLRGHQGKIQSAAFSPDGRRLVTVDLTISVSSLHMDKTARLWDARSGTSLAVLRHEDVVYSAAFSPDGQRLVTASADGTARLWDAASGTSLAVLRGDVVEPSHSTNPRFDKEMESLLDDVRSAAFSPDGQRLVTASDDGTARLWDAASGTSLAVLRHEGAVSLASFSPDGQRIVTASGDKARLWDVASGTSLAILHQEVDVYLAAFSPDGQRLVTASALDGTARLWDARSGTSLAVLRGHDISVFSAAFSPDGQRLVTVSLDGTARLWDARSGTSLAVLRHEGTVSSAAFSPDGQRIVTASTDGTARLWDARSGTSLAVLRQESAVFSAAFSPDGQRIVTASADGTARLWDARIGTSLAVLRHEGAVSSAAFSPDGQRIVTAYPDGTARLWDAGSGTSLAVLHGDVGEPLHSTNPLERSDKEFDKKMESILADSARSTSAITRGGSALPRERLPAFSPDGQRIVTTSADGTARLWDARSGTSLVVLQGDEVNVSSAAFSPDGQRVVTTSVDGTARLWDAGSGTSLVVLQGDDVDASSAAFKNVTSAAFSPDGQRIVTTSWDGTARLWDAGSGTSLAVLRHEDGVTSAAFSPDGQRLVTTSGDTARLWDAGSDTSLAILRHEGNVSAVSLDAFSPDGQRLVTASVDGTARLWDAGSGTSLAVLRHEDDVSSAAFSPDGQRVVTTSVDGTARLWDAGSGTSLAVLRHEGPVSSAAFSPDGQRLVTASLDGTARLWRVLPTKQDLIGIARCLVPRQLTGAQRRQFFLEETPLENGSHSTPPVTDLPCPPISGSPELPQEITVAGETTITPPEATSTPPETTSTPPKTTSTPPKTTSTPPKTTSLSETARTGADGEIPVYKDFEGFKECDVCPEMVALPGGTLTMGSPANEKHRVVTEGPQRQVTIEPFAIGKHEVTFAEWDACVAGGGCNGYRPDDGSTGDRHTQPVSNISWQEAQAYINWLAKQTGKPYRLPTEAEWEYAARAGTTTPFWFGKTLSTAQANYDGRTRYGPGSRIGEYRRQTVPVGSLPANPWGLYEIHGNVWELVEDCWHSNYKNAPPDSRAWIEPSCTEHVVRGGS